MCVGVCGCVGGCECVCVRAVLTKLDNRQSTHTLPNLPFIPACAGKVYHDRKRFHQRKVYSHGCVVRVMKTGCVVTDECVVKGDIMKLGGCREKWVCRDSFDVSSTVGVSLPVCAMTDGLIMQGVCATKDGCVVKTGCVHLHLTFSAQIPFIAASQNVHALTKCPKRVRRRRWLFPRVQGF